jgi:hypothetical protein
VLPLLAVDELVGHEIHRAGVVRPARPEALAAEHRHLPPPRPLRPQLQLLFLLDPVDLVLPACQPSAIGHCALASGISHGTLS